MTKIVSGRTQVTFIPERTRRGRLASVGEPVDLTAFVTAMDGFSVAARKAGDSLTGLAIAFSSGKRRHGLIKHRRDLRRARMKAEIRRMR